MKFYIADAFTDHVFGGNPAGVVILDPGSPYPAEEIMVKTAAELRYSETAFIKKLDSSSFELRYFTPAGEVDLCGHATIASFSVLMDAGLAGDNSHCTAKTQAGELSIELQNGFIMMEMAPPRCISEIRKPEALERLYSVMGICYEPVPVKTAGSRTMELLPDIISTGLPDIILPVKSRGVLAQIAPDFPALSQLSAECRVTGVHAVALGDEGSEAIAYCRNFAPLYDIDEEAATGTASGALTWYLSCRGLIGEEAESVFIQGEAMGRPSRILTRLRKADGGADGSVQIQVGGSAAILSKGEIFL